MFSLPQRALILTTLFNLFMVAFWGQAEWLMVAMGQVWKKAFLAFLFLHILFSFITYLFYFIKAFQKSQLVQMLQMILTFFE
jgi:hypothetical protein